MGPLSSASRYVWVVHPNESEDLFLREKEPPSSPRRPVQPGGLCNSRLWEALNPMSLADASANLSPLISPAPPCSAGRHCHHSAEPAGHLNQSAAWHSLNIVNGSRRAQSPPAGEPAAARPPCAVKEMGARTSRLLAPEGEAHPEQIRGRRPVSMLPARVPGPATRADMQVAGRPYLAEAGGSPS